MPFVFIIRRAFSTLLAVQRHRTAGDAADAYVTGRSERIYYIIEILHRELHGNAASLRRLRNGLLIVFPVSTLLGDLRGLTPIFYKPSHPVSVTTHGFVLFLPCDHCDSRDISMGLSYFFRF